jgi:predicted GIY-YIG superfamily endonuclease
MNANPHRRSYCTYIMGSLSGTLYIGVTGNLQKRAFDPKFQMRY